MKMIPTSAIEESESPHYSQAILRNPPTHSGIHWKILDYIGQATSLKTDFDNIIAHIALY